MAAGVTYTPIQTYTLSSATTVTFSSIPGTYTDLVLVSEATGTTNGAMDIRFNGDTGSNYSRTGMYWDGTTAAGYRSANLAYGLVGAGTTGRTFALTQIMNYSNASTNKSYISQDSSASATGISLYYWRGTAAITSITLTGDPIGSTIGSGSTFTLYGIARA